MLETRQQAREAPATAVSGFVGAGIGAAPDFEGSEDYEVRPLVTGSLKWRGYTIELVGLGARVDLLKSRAFSLGPRVSYRFGRDDDVENATVASLREVDDAIEAGFFAAYALQPGWLRGDRFEIEGDFSADVSGAHEGLTAGLTGKYGWQAGERVRLTTDAGLTYADGNYMESYFGVDAGNAARSGLPQFQADAGIKDAGVGLTALVDLEGDWGLLARLSYTRLLADAADSPIVDDEGDANQFFGGVGVSYRW